MPTASESRLALRVVTGAAITASWQLLHSLTGPPEAQRAALLEAVPEVIAYHSLGSSALAADFYDDERERAAARSRFFADPVIVDRVEKIRRNIAWASQPMFNGSIEATTQDRLAEVVQMETARPYRDTITTNRRRDPEAVGWRRVAAGGCRFCRMLADKGAIFREETVRFAAHDHCSCTAQPVFKSNDTGEEVDVMQYVASKRHRTEAEKAKLRAYLDEHYGDASGGSGGRPSIAKTVPGAAQGLKALSRAQVEHQLKLTEGLKESDWRTTQLARLRERMSEFN